MNKNFLSIASASVLFFILISIGFVLAEHKPLWNDELYTQIHTVEKLTYSQLLLGHIKEGNNSPLFYSLQKTICRLLRYRLPVQWNLETYVHSVPSQIVLRILPNILMSLSVAIIFYFFCRYYSYGVGLYSLAVSLSTFMVWGFWVESRPYTAWIFLTTLQSLIFLYMVKEKDFSPQAWKWLTVAHILLSLTIALSLMQIVIISFLLWIFIDRKWRRYIFLTILPIAICIFYRQSAPQYQFWFLNTPMQLIHSCVPKDRIFIFFLYFIFLIVMIIFKSRRKNISFKKRIKNFRWKEIVFLRNKEIPSRRMGKIYLAFTILMFMATFALLVLFKIKASETHDGFSINNRYFIYLTPIGIIAATVFSADMIRAFKGQRWMLINTSIILGGLLIIRLLSTYLAIMATSVYWF